MPYVGWKIYTYSYEQDPAHRRRTSKAELLEDLHRRFADADWLISSEGHDIILSNLPSKTDIKMVIHGFDMEIPYSEGPETETYLIQLESDCLAWKQAESDHKRLMREVIRRLPWETVGCHLDDSHVIVVSSTNIEGPCEPFEVNPKPWVNCPIPETPPRRRRNMVRPRVIKRKRARPLRRADSLTKLIREVDEEKAKAEK
jgi:hypothetical protein